VLVDYIAIVRLYRYTSQHRAAKCGVCIEMCISVRGRSGNPDDLLAAGKANHQQLSKGM
jgi:hypothetical protein